MRGECERKSAPQNVARAYYSADQRRRKVAVHLGAQPVHMHVDNISTRLEVIIPRCLEQHAPRHDLPGMAHQACEQQEFAMLQVQVSSGPGGGSGPYIK